MKSTLLSCRTIVRKPIKPGVAQAPGLTILNVDFEVAEQL
jgi:hypothetical protein